MKIKTLRSLSLVVALFAQTAEIGIKADARVRHSSKSETALTIFALADGPEEVPPAAILVGDGPEEVPPAAMLIADGPEEVPPAAILIADGPEEVPPSTLLVG
jgi:hypothetical protein